MGGNHELVFYHMPGTRSSDVLRLLEALKAPYQLKLLNLKQGKQKDPSYLAINPMGKVPAIVHGDAVVTEVIAIYIYLADLFPEAKLAPAISDSGRGTYLRWLVYYAGCFEPALMDYSLKREPAPRASCPYGNYATVIKTIEGQLAKGAYIAGESFTAADVLWGSALAWAVETQLVASSASIAAYIERVNEKPYFAAAKAKDEQLLASA